MELELKKQIFKKNAVKSVLENIPQKWLSQIARYEDINKLAESLEKIINF